MRGTSAEPLFREYGPAFSLVILNEPLDPESKVATLRLLMRMHGIFVGELQALEGAARSLWDFPDAPWEFKMNMARQCWDEARHVQIYEKLLEHVGGEVGMYAESTFLFECCCAIVDAPSGVEISNTAPAPFMTSETDPTWVIMVFWGSFAMQNPKQNMENAMTLMEWYGEGKLKPHIHGVYDLADTPKALEEMMNREVKGKLVIGM